MANGARKYLREYPNVTQDRPFLVPFGRNENFVGRDTILQQLLVRIPPDANRDDCQRTALEGLGGIGKTQIALEAAYRVRDKHPDCSIFWVPAVDATSFENAYRDIGRQLEVKGIEDDKADVKMLVKAALSHESAGSWLMIVNNADNIKLVTTLSKYLPSNQKALILFTTRNHSIVSSLNISPKGLINVGETSQEELFEILKKYLLNLLANLPLAIRQASAYMFENEIPTTQYLRYCQSNDKDIVEFICFLTEKDIPISLLPPRRNKQEINKALERNKPKLFDIHRLIRLTMHTMKVFQHLTNKYPFLKHENQSIWIRYLPHGQVVLHLRNEFAGEETGLLFNVAESYSQLSKYKEAEQMYRQTLELRERVLGREHPDTLGSMRCSLPSTRSLNSSVCRCISSASSYFPWLLRTPARLFMLPSKSLRLSPKPGKGNQLKTTNMHVVLVFGHVFFPD
ncbi:P-loop containing nucleoside triphosphate hydrolase protein [Hypoxylon sp. NC1633]|nr:P-loop containing nucleoside triphosphate hydrolase protein [Hypoxylon sp. NC1633]